MYIIFPCLLFKFTLYQKPFPISQLVPWDTSIPFHVKPLIKAFAISRRNNSKKDPNILPNAFLISSDNRFMFESLTSITLSVSSEKLKT